MAKASCFGLFRLEKSFFAFGRPAWPRLSAKASQNPKASRGRCKICAKSKLIGKI
jgi:hypothetical protein